MSFGSVMSRRRLRLERAPWHVEREIGIQGKVVDECTIILHVAVYLSSQEIPLTSFVKGKLVGRLLVLLVMYFSIMISFVFLSYVSLL